MSPPSAVTFKDSITYAYVSGCRTAPLAPSLCKPNKGLGYSGSANACKTISLVLV